MPDNLPELRDIHLPADVSVFPLGYGWWVVLSAIILAIALYYLTKFIIKKSKKLYALNLLAKTDLRTPLQSASLMSEVLRRICIYKFPQAAALSGDEWIGFLNSKAKYKLEKNAATLLKDAPYMPLAKKINDDKSVVELKKFCQKWIGENL